MFIAKKIFVEIDGATDSVAYNKDNDTTSFSECSYPAELVLTAG